VRRQCALNWTESHITSTTALYRSGKPRLGKLQRLEPSSLPVHPWSGYGSALRSDGAQIASRGLSGPAIGDNLERDLLLLVEAVHLDAPLADIERRFVLVLIEIAANPQRDVEKLFLPWRSTPS
jgi:hypothetical protein